MKNFILQPIFFLLSILFIFTLSCNKENFGINDDYYENEEGKVEVLLTFQNFKNHVKTLQIDGFTLISITAGEDGEKEYLATFKNKNGKYLYIKIGELATSEPVWYNPQNTYMLDGRKAEYANTILMHGLTIHLPQIEAEMDVYATIDLGKSTFEGIARRSGFLTIDPETVDWPANIPENHKLSGWLLDVKIDDYYDSESFTKQMFATMMVNDVLVNSYQEVFNAYYDSYVNHIVFPNGTYLIPVDDSNGNLYDFYDEYERIEFVYYMP